MSKKDMNEEIKTILVAPDKFKGTMTAAEAAHCIAEVLRLYGCDAVEMPMADGGWRRGYSRDGVANARACRV